MSFEQYTLENGMNVILQPQPTAPVVACNVWVGVGSADETPDEAGLAHVHEHMLFKGTEKRGVGEVAKEIERSGGYMNAFTSFDQTCYYVVMSSRFLERGIDILSDVVQNSSFEADELARELEVIQEEIKRGNDDPQRVASQLLFETAYSTHPYRLPIIGTKESVDSFERQNVQNFFEKHYVPKNMTFVLAGDFEVEDARKLIEQYFGKTVERPRDDVERPTEPPQNTTKAAVKTQDVNESHLRIAFHIPDIQHEDIPALDVLGVVLGYGEASRLHQEVVRKQRLANGASSGAYTPKNDGLFIASADYQLADGTDHAEVARAVLKEVFGFEKSRVDAHEITRAKNILESQEIYGRQTVEGLAMKLGRSYIVTGDVNFEEVFNEKVSQVTETDMRRVAAKYLVPNNCTLTLVCDEGSEPASDVLVKAVHDAFESVTVSHLPVREVDDRGFAVEHSEDLTIVVQEDHAVETMAIRALTDGGLRFEDASNNGVSAMVAELLTKGTARMDAVAISNETESCATSIGGISGRNSIGLGMSGLSKHYNTTRDIFFDCLRNATFPEDEFEHAQMMQQQAIQARLDRLGAVTFDRFAPAFFGDHPYAMPTVGTDESVASLTRDSSHAFKERLFNKGHWVVSIVGDVDASEAIDYVTKQMTFGDDQPSVEPPSLPTERPRFVVGDLDREQSFVTVGFDAPKMSDDGRYAMEVMHSILSGQGGRLFYELRDKQSLAYSVYVSMLMGVEASTFMVNIGTSPEKIETAVKGIFEEIRKLSAGVTEDEIDRAKTYLIGTNDIGLQRNTSRAMGYALDELYGFGYERTLHYGEAIGDVSQGDLEKFVETYLNVEKAVVAITKPSDLEVDVDKLSTF